jgi:tellurite resistance protein TerC
MQMREVAMEFLLALWLGTPLWMWLLFIAVVIALLVFDLGVLHKGDHEIGVAESLRLSAMYIVMGVLFAGFVWWQIGGEPASLYLTAFVVEKTLAMDNVFVIAMIFGYFAIPAGLPAPGAVLGHPGGDPAARDHDRPGRDAGRAVFLGALHLRGVPDLYRHQDDDDGREGDGHLEEPRPAPPQAAHERHRGAARQQLLRPQAAPRDRPDGALATPLFLALVLIEIADVIFAVDSVPAVFAITADPFIVYTSNIFAILGLRALYFALAAIIHRFHYLKYASRCSWSSSAPRSSWPTSWAGRSSPPAGRWASPSQSGRGRRLVAVEDAGRPRPGRPRRPGGVTQGPPELRAAPGPRARALRLLRSCRHRLARPLCEPAHERHRPASSDLSPGRTRARVAAFLEKPPVRDALMAVILFNAAILGLETLRGGDGPAGGLIHALDRLCLAIFVAELLAKLYALGRALLPVGLEPLRPRGGGGLARPGGRGAVGPARACASCGCCA